MTVSLRCGCSPRNRVVCRDHCQWQGCEGNRHTDACIRGERVADEELRQADDAIDIEPGLRRIIGEAPQ